MDDTVIKDDDVYWVMTWGKSFPDKPPTELMFEETAALARLLAADVIILNNFWWEDSWPKKAQNAISVSVNCSDIFAYACADAENVDYQDVKSLYDYWSANKIWGPAIWCAIKRNEKPVSRVIERMKNARVWTEQLEALGENRLNDQVQSLITHLGKE